MESSSDAMAQPERPRTKKHECVLVEAARAFARFGLRKTSIDEIARAAGVGKGTVYLVAKSKEELYVEVLRAELLAWVEECGHAIDESADDTPASDLMAKLLATALASLARRPLVEGLLARRVDQELLGRDALLEELRSCGRKNIERVLCRGVERGEFRASLDTHRVGIVLHDMVLSALLLHGDSDNRMISLMDHARVGLDLVLKGLEARVES